MSKITPVVALLMILVSSHATVYAVKLTFTMLEGRIYVETDSEHYAMYGQVKSENNGYINIVAVNKLKHVHLTLDCRIFETNLGNVRKSDLQDYARIRDRNLAVKQESPALSNTKNTDYTWSQTFSAKEKDFFMIKLDKNTAVYSSEYFPDYIARVIISGKVVIFVHDDGDVVMKTMDCLRPNERNLIKGIKKIKTCSGLASCFSSKDDRALGKHLRSDPIHYERLWREQEYKMPLTEREIRERAEKDRAIVQAFTRKPSKYSAEESFDLGL